MAPATVAALFVAVSAGMGGAIHALLGGGALALGAGALFGILYQLSLFVQRMGS